MISKITCDVIYAFMNMFAILTISNTMVPIPGSLEEQNMRQNNEGWGGS